MSCVSDFIPFANKPVKLAGMLFSEIDQRKQSEYIKNFKKIANSVNEMQEIVEAVAVKAALMNLAYLLENEEYTSPKELINTTCSPYEPKIILGTDQELEECFLVSTADDIEALAIKHAGIVAKEVIQSLFISSIDPNLSIEDKIGDLLGTIELEFIRPLEKDRPQAVAEMILRIVKEKSDGKWKESKEHEEKFIAHVKKAIEAGQIRFDLNDFLKSDIHRGHFCKDSITSHFVSEKIEQDNPFELELAGDSLAENSLVGNLLAENPLAENPLARVLAGNDDDIFIAQ